MSYEWKIISVVFNIVKGSVIYLFKFLVLQEWVYHLNEGSQINISYSVASWGSSSIFLVIAKGNFQFLLNRSL